MSDISLSINLLQAGDGFLSQIGGDGYLANASLDERNVRHDY